MAVTSVSRGVDSVSGPPKVDAAKFAASRQGATLKADKVAAERMALADAVYKDASAKDADGPPGWHRETGVELSALHLDPAQFTPAGSHFRAALFQGPNGQKVLAFKGTEGMNARAYEDWTNNLEQGFGFKSDYYSRAIRLATDVVKATGGHVEMTGHSLGGGMAAAAGLATHSRTTTFDAAGVNGATAIRYGFSLADATKPMPDGRPLIDRYDVQGEILDVAQHAAPAILTILTPGTQALLELSGHEPQRAQGVVHMLPDPAPLSVKQHIMAALGGPHAMEIVDLKHAINEHLPPVIEGALEAQITQDQKHGN